VWRERRNLLRYLRWGAENARYQPATTPPPFA